MPSRACSQRDRCACKYSRMARFGTTARRHWGRMRLISPRSSSACSHDSDVDSNSSAVVTRIRSSTARSRGYPMAYVSKRFALEATSEQSWSASKRSTPAVPLQAVINPRDKITIIYSTGSPVVPTRDIRSMPHCGVRALGSVRSPCAPLRARFFLPVGRMIVKKSSLASALCPTGDCRRPPTGYSFLSGLLKIYRNACMGTTSPTSSVSSA